MKVIEKIKLFNFKRFQQLEVEFDETLNIFIGDNEAGKSSILTAIDLVLSGSRSKVETIGLDNLFNVHAISEFLGNDKTVNELPTMYVELYLNEQGNLDLNGRNNSEDRICDGLRLVCEPMDEYNKDVQDVLEQENTNFPFEYYSIKHTTFSGESYSGYRKFLKHLLIDSSQINNEYATREYIRTIYRANIVTSELYRHKNEYRQAKKNFKSSVLDPLNNTLVNFSFDIRSNSKSDLETDLTITEEEISIENKGKGRQSIIKTEFALLKKHAEKDIDVLLLEEPENHLSHLNMKKLIRRISESAEKQLFIATHNNLISTRLDLRKAIMLNSNSTDIALLNRLPEETAKFFMKAPNNNILEFILSRKVILVEGDAEFILIEAFYQNLAGESLEASDIHVISVGGTSFKRYLDLARILQIKTAVVTDNDGDPQTNCIDKYSNYREDYIKVFFEREEANRTFEFCLYEQNITLCDELFFTARRTLSVLDYMLNNKADVAFELLDKKGPELVAPTYIQDAIEWIRR